jgi:hypothetical protein
MRKKSKVKNILLICVVSIILFGVNILTGRLLDVIVGWGPWKKIEYDGTKYYREFFFDITDAYDLQNAEIVSFYHCEDVTVKVNSLREKTMKLYSDPEKRFIYDDFNNCWFLRAETGYPEYSLENIAQIKLVSLNLKREYVLNEEETIEFYQETKSFSEQDGDDPNAKIVGTDLCFNIQVSFLNAPESAWWNMYKLQIDPRSEEVIFEMNIQEFDLNSGVLKVEGELWENIYDWALQSDS